MTKNSNYCKSHTSKITVSITNKNFRRIPETSFIYYINLIDKYLTYQLYLNKAKVTAINGIMKCNENKCA